MRITVALLERMDQASLVRLVRLSGTLNVRWSETCQMFLLDAENSVMHAFLRHSVSFTPRVQALMRDGERYAHGLGSLAKNHRAELDDALRRRLLVPYLRTELPGGLPERIQLWMLDQPELLPDALARIARYATSDTVRSRVMESDDHQVHRSLVRSMGRYSSLGWSFSTRLRVAALLEDEEGKLFLDGHAPADRDAWDALVPTWSGNVDELLEVCEELGPSA